MKGERYKKLKKLPKGTPIEKTMTAMEYAAKRGVTVGAIYLMIDRVHAKQLKWSNYQCYQHKGKVYVIEKS